MTLECINSNAFDLSHAYNNPRQRITIAKAINQSDGSIISTNGYVQARKSEGTLTYTIEEVKEYRQYTAYGSYTSVGIETCGDTLYWMSKIFSGETRDNVSIYSKGGGETIFYVDIGDPPITNRYGIPYEFDCRKISLSKYEELEDDSIPFLNTQIPETPVYRVVREGCTDPATYRDASSLSDVKIRRVGTAFWKITFFLNGQFYQEKTTKAYYLDPFSLYEGITIEEEVPSTSYATKSFTKKKNTQAVEVLLDPDKPHGKQVWLVDLDEEGEEIGRSIIFEFERAEGQSPPSHRITCIETSECPENTCKVDCNTHYCCYNSEGISIESFAK